MFCYSMAAARKAITRLEQAQIDWNGGCSCRGFGSQVGSGGTLILIIAEDFTPLQAFPQACDRIVSCLYLV